MLRATTVRARRCLGPSLLCSLLATGCTISTLSPTHSTETATAPTLASAPGGAPIFLPSPLRYTPSEVPFKNHLLEAEQTPHYRVRHIRIPSAGDNGQPDDLVTGHYWETRAAGPRPLVIVLPIWGGSNYPSKKIAGHIRQKSRGEMSVFILEGENHLFDWKELERAHDPERYLDIWRRGAERERVTMIDVRRLIDWASVRPEVDATRIALVGFSHSAVLATSLAPHEPRLAAVASLMGGAFIHEILATCPLRRSEGARRRARETFGWSTADLAERLEPIFAPLDPTTYPGRVDPRRILLTEATKDHCMPEPGRRALVAALGRPETVSIEATHRRAFLALTPVGGNRLRGIVWRFLERRLLAAPPGAAGPPSSEATVYVD